MRLNPNGVIPLSQNKWPSRRPEAVKARVHKWCLKHPGYYKRKHGELRMKVIERLGSKCVVCGCLILDALEINHINGGGYKTKQEISIIKAFNMILHGTYPYPVELTCRVCNSLRYLESKGFKGWKVIWNET